MAKYELTEVDVKNLLAIIANASVKGSECITISNLIRKLSTPIKDKKKV